MHKKRKGGKSYQKVSPDSSQSYPHLRALKIWKNLSYSQSYPHYPQFWCVKACLYTGGKETDVL